MEIRTYYTGNVFSVEGPPKEGGMGRVYVGKREKDGRRYALKTIVMRESPERKSRPNERLDSLLKLFQQESYIWIVLGKHRNIVQAHWFDFSDGYEPFLIMEYVPGYETCISLQDWLDSANRYSRPWGQTDVATALRFTIEAITGLICARDLVRREFGGDFMHLDIKPANLLLDTDGTVKVSDFGLARLKATPGRWYGGTPGYMPAEQHEKKPIVEKSDIYALGCVLYQLLTGSPSPPWSGKLVNDLPEHLSQIVAGCLDERAGNRPDFESFRESLQEQYRRLTSHSLPIIDVQEQSSAEEWKNRGVGFDQLGYHDRALDCYNRAIVIDNRDARFYLDRGSSRVRRGQHAEAIEDFRQALTIDSNLVEAYINLGSVCGLNKEYEEAGRFYTLAKGMNPTEGRIHVGLGNLCAMRGDFKKAKEEFEIALRLNSRLAEPHLGLGNVYRCLGDFSGAREEYENALKKNRWYAKARDALAKISADS